MDNTGVSTLPMSPPDASLTPDNPLLSRLLRDIEAAGGWLGFDVSNQCLAGGRYVKLAIGADYLDACPVRGVRRGGGGEEMQAAAWVWLDQQQQ